MGTGLRVVLKPRSETEPRSESINNPKQDRSQSSNAGQKSKPDGSQSEGQEAVAGLECVSNKSGTVTVVHRKG